MQSREIGLDVCVGKEDGRKVKCARGRWFSEILFFLSRPQLTFCFLALYLWLSACVDPGWWKMSVYGHRCLGPCDLYVSIRKTEKRGGGDL